MHTIPHSPSSTHDQPPPLSPSQPKDHPSRSHSIPGGYLPQPLNDDPHGPGGVGRHQVSPQPPPHRDPGTSRRSYPQPPHAAHPAAGPRRRRRSSPSPPCPVRSIHHHRRVVEDVAVSAGWAPGQRVAVHGEAGAGAPAVLSGEARAPGRLYLAWPHPAEPQHPAQPRREDAGQPFVRPQPGSRPPATSQVAGMVFER